jgi:hypothetical protein
MPANAASLTQALFGGLFLCFVHMDSPLLKKSTHRENEQPGFIGPNRLTVNLDR